MAQFLSRSTSAQYAWPQSVGGPTLDCRILRERPRGSVHIHRTSHARADPEAAVGSTPSGDFQRGMRGALTTIVATSSSPPVPARPHMNHSMHVMTKACMSGYRPTICSVSVRAARTGVELPLVSACVYQRLKWVEGQTQTEAYQAKILSMQMRAFH